MNKTAIIFCGLPASGKTTLYEERFRPLGYKRIGMDARHARDREANELQHAIENGESIVIDGTNVTRSERRRYLDMLKGRDYTVECWFFESRVKECVARNERRASPAPVKDIAAMSNRLDLPSRDEGFDDIKHVSVVTPVFEIVPYVEQTKAPSRERNAEKTARFIDLLFGDDRN